MTASLGFVDNITASPTTLLNLNDEVEWSAKAETDFGAPPLRRNVVGSLMSDGEQIAASAFGNREIKLVLEILASTADAAAAQLQKLIREFDKPRNLLRYQTVGVTNPVFFRTFRAALDAVTFDPINKRVTATVPAEPYALGLREDLGPFTVNNDPAAGSNGLFLDLTGIKGDVATPLFLEYVHGGGDLNRSGLGIGVRTGPAPYPNRVIQAEAMGVLTDTTVTADAAFSGGSKVRCTFTTVASMTSRIASNFPSLTDPAGAENWGSYRVFARVAKTVAGDVIKMQARVGGGTSNVAATLLAQTQAQLVDLGVLSSTVGLPTIPGYHSVPYRLEDQIGIFVQAERVSGTGSLDIDFLALLPADETLCTWGQLGAVASTSEQGVVDTPNDAVYTASALTAATPGRLNTLAGITGQLPYVKPGDNRLVIIEPFPAGASPVANTLTKTFVFTARYWPRYLYVRPSGT